jgi:hypothetical protein
MKKYLPFGLVFLVVVLGLALAMILLVRDTTLQALNPFQQTNNDLRTQVAEFIHPTPTILPDPVTIIHEVRALARLETIQYSVEKVITADSGQAIFRPLFGDKLLFVAHGTVIAGIDLNKLMPSDLVMQNNILKIRLPDPEIFSATLDNQKSYVFDRQTGILTHGQSDLETLARQAAEKEIYQAALDDGILIQAQINAENYLSRLLQQLGFNEVIFINPTLTPPD